VPYPPQMQPIPVKPLFLDVAWNYIDYPREGQQETAHTAPAAPAPAPPQEEENKSRRGWFGFGRS
jgi:signal recognition particle subunit SRP68